MSDIERTDEQPEVEGHLTPDGDERRPHAAPERMNMRTGRPLSEEEEEGAEVEGHRYYSGPERMNMGAERLNL